MNIVVAAATENEIAPLKSRLTPENLLITGLGSAITAYHLMRFLSASRPDLIIQAGIAGSFREELAPGGVALVERDVFADLGAIEGDELVDIFDLGLHPENEPPFRQRWLVNPYVANWPALGLPLVKAATVNNISASSAQVQRILHKYGPDIEAMEGAAFHFVCLKEGIPFVQLRAVSNFAGDRNKKNWKMKEAILALNESLEMLINRLQPAGGV